MEWMDLLKDAGIAGVIGILGIVALRLFLGAMTARDSVIKDIADSSNKCITKNSEAIGANTTAILDVSDAVKDLRDTTAEFRLATALLKKK